MKHLPKYVALLIVTIAAFWTMPPEMRAQSSNQAALVIRYGDDDLLTACIDFEQPQITGYELLQRSGVDLLLDAQGMGALVCSIDGTGCPANDCLCQCKGGGDCVYWSYWHRLGGTWQYSQGGASVYKVEPGAVEGWSWGPGNISQAVAPPDLTFADVCQTTATDTPTASPTATLVPPAVVNTPKPSATQDATQSTAANTPTRTPTNTATLPTPLPTVTATSATPATPTMRQQTTTTSVQLPTDTPSLRTTAAPIVASPTVEITDRESDKDAQREAPIVDRAAGEKTAAEEAARPATLAPLAVAQRVNPGSLEEATPAPNLQQKSAPSIEPTAPLQVIGQGIDPISAHDHSESAPGAENSAGITGLETPSYIVFVLIVAGLVTLLVSVSHRRRSEP